MRKLTISIFICLFSVFSITLFKGKETYCQNGKATPVEDVFKVMEIVTKSIDKPLWPNFKATEIPVLVFDSINTWLFYSNVPPDGFNEVKMHPGVYMFTGKYPLVQGNSIVRISNSWIATCKFSSYAQRTGEKYSARDLAGIIIHEQFHIFQKTKHPKWQQNDGYLLLYPTESQEALFLRRIEKEAFKRAVLSNKQVEIAGWAKVALNYREQRLSMIPSDFRRYEKELQRTEGLSDYIEKIARGLDPLNASNITNGIAPAGVRDLGYVEGRWIAMVLDKLNPEWKSILEENDALYLEDILKNVIKEMPFDSVSFSSLNIDKLKAETNTDFIKWQEKKSQEMKQFNIKSGFRIEINALTKPLNIRIFEPLEIEILDDRSVFHRLIFAAGNENGSVRIMNLPCITWFNNSLGIEKLVFNGLKESPVIIENENKIVIKNNNISIELKYSKLQVENSLYIIEL